MGTPRAGLCYQVRQGYMKFMAQCQQCCMVVHGGLVVKVEDMKYYDY